MTSPKTGTGSESIKKVDLDHLLLHTIAEPCGGVCVIGDSQS